MTREEIIHKMKLQGKRITEQRKVLLDIILEHPHDSCKEIYYEALKVDPSIGIATVYRMMNTLEDLGAISRFYSYPVGQKYYSGTSDSERISIINGKTLKNSDSKQLYDSIKVLLRQNGVLEKNEQDFAATIVIQA